MKYINDIKNVITKNINSFMPYDESARASQIDNYVKLIADSTHRG